MKKHIQIASTPSLDTIHEDDQKTLQMLLVAFIEKGDWKRLKLAITIPIIINAAWFLDENSQLYGANILHIALCNNPPIDIIQSLLQTFPETPFLHDSVGRYPLHVACSVGISTEAVMMIADAYPGACMKQDLDGKAPIHFACDANFILYERDINANNSRRDGHLIFSTIVSLVSLAPSSIHLEDCDEMNAIELAILSDASKTLVSLLQNVSALEHKKLLNKDTASMKRLEKHIANMFLMC